MELDDGARAGYFLPNMQEIKALPIEKVTLSSGILFENGF